MAYHPISYTSRLDSFRAGNGGRGFVALSNEPGGQEVGRVGYGPTEHDKDPIGVWMCDETPDDITPADMMAVRGYLAEQMPRFAQQPQFTERHSRYEALSFPPKN